MFLSKLIPSGKLRKKLGCFYQRHFFNNSFKLYYKNGFFEVHFNDVDIRFSENLHGQFETLEGFLKNYDPKKGDVVIDAGAYKGAFAIYAAKKVGGGGKVISFEPDPNNYEVLCKNIRLNNLDNVIAVKKGLWSRNTILNLFLSGSTSSCFNVFGRETCKIQVVRLDDELKRLGINKVDFIKMDIEGAEIETVKGCKDILKNNNVNIAIASYHRVNNKPTYIFLEDFFRKMGYKAWTSNRQHLTTYAFRKK